MLCLTSPKGNALLGQGWSICRVWKEVATTTKGGQSPHTNSDNHTMALRWCQGIFIGLPPGNAPHKNQAIMSLDHMRCDKTSYYLCIFTFTLTVPSVMYFISL